MPTIVPKTKLAQFLAGERERRGIRIIYGDICRLADVNQAHFSKILRGMHDPLSSSKRRIEAALTTILGREVTPEELWESAS